METILFVLSLVALLGMVVAPFKPRIAMTTSRAGAFVIYFVAAIVLIMIWDTTQTDLDVGSRAFGNADWHTTTESLSQIPPGHQDYDSAQLLLSRLGPERAAAAARAFAAERAAMIEDRKSTPSPPRPEKKPSSSREVVTNSAWDGSVRQVDRYLKREVLKDPDSYQSIEWSQVQKTETGGYMVRHKFRAKNSFGGYVGSTYGFILDSQGNVVSAIPME